LEFREKPQEVAMSDRKQAPKKREHPMQTVGFIITVVSVLAYMSYAIWYVVTHPEVQRPGWRSNPSHLMALLIPGIPALILAAFGQSLYEAPERGFRWGEVVGIVLSTVIGGLIVGWIIANAGR